MKNTIYALIAGVFLIVAAAFPAFAGDCTVNTDVLYAQAQEQAEAHVDIKPVLTRYQGDRGIKFYRALLKVAADAAGIENPEYATIDEVITIQTQQPGEEETTTVVMALEGCIVGVVKGVPTQAIKLATARAFGDPS